MSIHKSFTSRATASAAGFTVVELLTIVLILGIVSAVSAPAWQMFINHYRIKTSVDRAYQAMVTARSNAKRDKIAWQASFKQVGNIVQVAIHKSDTPPATVPPGEWKSLEPDIQINPNETTFVLFNEQNEYDKNGAIRRAMFNFQGCPVYKSTDDCGLTSIRAKATLTLSHPHLPKGDRCVIISTILGHKRIAQRQKKAQDGRYCY